MASKKQKTSYASKLKEDPDLSSPLHDEQLKDQREEIKMFEQLLAERFTELREELRQIRKRKQPTQRVHRTEPQRRQIAKRQNWLCAGQQCQEAQTKQELQEYDIDHIIPLHLGGTEEPDNLQALCPGCHRRKTDQERIDALISTNVSYKTTRMLGIHQ
jgi:5-methylcytosine-specific restriction endonuclease McrA